MDVTWDPVEPWDTPRRSPAEAMELATRLHKRTAEQWRRLLAQWERETDPVRNPNGFSLGPSTGSARKDW